jgi:hypothetical protein
MDSNSRKSRLSGSASSSCCRHVAEPAQVTRTRLAHAPGPPFAGAPVVVFQAAAPAVVA